MIKQSQQDFLKAGKAQLGATWDEFAALVGIDPRAFKTYRMPVSSKDYRTMNHFVWDAIIRVLEEQRNRARNKFDLVRAAYYIEFCHPA